MRKILLIFSVVLITIACQTENKQNRLEVPLNHPPSEQIEEDNDNIMTEKDVVLALTGSGYKKAELMLGYYDDLESSSSSYIDCILYRNKVKNSKGEVLNVVLVIRFIEMFDWNIATIMKVYTLPEGGKCRCGLTPLSIKNGKLI